VNEADPAGARSTGGSLGCPPSPCGRASRTSPPRPFASGVFREPLAGVDCVVPVADDVTLVLIGAHTAGGRHRCAVAGAGGEAGPGPGGEPAGAVRHRRADDRRLPGGGGPARGAARLHRRAPGRSHRGDRGLVAGAVGTPARRWRSGCLPTHRSSRSSSGTSTTRCWSTADAAERPGGTGSRAAPHPPLKVASPPVDACLRGPWNRWGGLRCMSHPTYRAIPDRGSAGWAGDGGRAAPGRGRVRV
jgi:hypothetical protein